MLKNLEKRAFKDVQLVNCMNVYKRTIIGVAGQPRERGGLWASVGPGFALSPFALWGNRYLGFNVSLYGVGVI